jgi:hypothetical protein
MSKRQTKRSKKYTESDAFDELLNKIVAEICANHAPLIKNTGWILTPDLRAQLLVVYDNLALRFMHRCSLLAMHRTNTAKPEKMKKAKVVLNEADVEVAWLTLQKDEQYK